MINVNENFLKLKGSYLFANIAKKVKSFKESNPEAKLISLGIGDVTLPLPKAVTEAMHKAVDEMSNADTFRGYGPDYGYAFLIEQIVKEYADRGVNIEKDEVFISDGAKSDTGNIGDIFSQNNVVALTDPVYPVYVDTNVMAGRSGTMDEQGKWSDIVYIPCTGENNFIPQIPNEKVDVIYLCFPNNPTGTTISRDELKKWVDYARANKAIILYDAAYEAYITETDVPRSIFEIEGAHNVAIEFRSFSKNAGFTGTRCGFTVIPKTVMAYTENEEERSANKLWARRQSTKFNGTAYIIQRAAEAVYSPEGRKQTSQMIAYYMENAKLIRDALEETGQQVFGGINAPYIWLKTPNGKTSWGFFDILLEKAHIISTPGVGFGPSGEGYCRLTAFGTREDTLEAIERIKKLSKEL